MIGLQMVQNVVCLRPAAVPSETANGILLGPSALRTCEGEVVAVGPGLMNKRGKRISCEVQVGDNVLFGHGKGEKIRYNGESLIMIREPDIDLILDKPQGNSYDSSGYYEIPEGDA